MTVAASHLRASAVSRYWPVALRLGRDALTLAGLVYLTLIWLGVADYGRPYPAYGPMGDAYAYWSFPAADPYAGGVLGGHGALLYSPVFAQVALVFKAVPFYAFYAAWVAAGIGILFYLRVPYLLAFPPVTADLVHGNINIMLALAIIVGMRHPAAWVAVLLTKVTPGIGVIWFALRREWRSLAIATLATGGAAILSLVLAPAWWVDWVSTLAANVDAAPPSAALPVPLLIRLPIALGVLAWGALSGRRWVVPIAACLALPAIWMSGAAILVAVIPLMRNDSARPLRA